MTCRTPPRGSGFFESGTLLRVLIDGFPGSPPALRYAGSKAKCTMIRESYDLDIACCFGRDGYRRLRAQHVKANISPWDCCVATAAGTSAWRLKTDESGFEHLYLAGTWIDTGFNTECVETAVISGMQAARAITSAGGEIPGERFLHATRQYLSLCDVMRGCAPAPAE